MDGNDSQPCTLQAIIGKIGHPLEEVRLRALNNILLKLEHGLLQELDLIKDKRLLVGLFEWFNFPDSPKQPEVLKLILQLSKRVEAHQQFISIGAIKFLSDLRENHIKNEQKVIDQILENLFLLPDAHVIEDDDETNPLCLSSVIQQNSITGANNNGQTQGQKQTDISNDNSVFQVDVTNQPENNNTLSAPKAGQEFIGFNMLSLKWISVSATDMNILSSTNESLESTDSKSVITSCNFLNDVVFRDFPPEIFLQHSQIIKNLFRLLTYTPKTPNHVPLKAVSCLLNLIKALHVQISKCQDAAFYNFKQSSGGPTAITPDELSDQSVESLDSRPSAIGYSNLRPRGDGQDGDISPDNGTIPANQSCSSICSFDASFLPNNHSQEISIPHFCVQVFSSSGSLLCSSNPQVLTAILELLLLNCDLLGRCINVQIWNDSSNLAQELTEQLLKCYDVLSSTILVHLEQNTGNQEMSKIHRLSVVSIALLWAKLLQTSINLQENITRALPESCLVALKQLMLDFLFAKMQPSVHGFFTKFVSVVSPANYLAYKMACELSESLNSAIRCVKMFKECQENTEMFRCSEQALSCLHYFHYWDYVDCFIKCLSKVCADGTLCGSVKEIGVASFLKLLAYPDVLVRSRVVSTSLNIVKDCLGIDKTADITLSSCYNIRFLLNATILQQIIQFGLEDSSTEVSAMIREILLYLVQSKLLMASEVWEEFLTSLLPVLSILQAYTDTTTSFGLSLFNLVSKDNANLSRIALLRANVRLLFSKDQWLRMQVIPRIAWFIAQEKKSIYKLPSLPEIDASILSDIYVKEYLPLQSDFQPRLGFSQNPEKLFQLFASNNEELYTRKSAGQQLTFLLNDSDFFDQFKQNFMSTTLLDILCSCLTAISPGVKHKFVDLIPLTIEIIWKCLMKDVAHISCIANNEYAFYSLLRATLIFAADKQICGRIQMIIAAMSFNDCCEIFSKNESTLIFRAFAPIHERFVLPSVEVMHESSRHCVTLFPVKFDDPCTDELFNAYLRFSWHVENSGGWDKFIVLESLPNNCKFSCSTAEQQLIKVTQQILNPELAFKEIIKAASHKRVLLLLKLTSWQLTAAPLLGIHYTESLKAEVFQAAFLRFLSTPPRSNADKTLVRNILQFLNLVMHCHPALNENVMEWFYSLISLKDGAINRFLQKPSDLFDKNTNKNNPSHYNPLVKELLAFFISLLSKTPFTENYIDSQPIKMALASMIQFILRHMNLAEAPQFYNLASLEAVLQCLVHITSRSGFSQGTSNDAGAYLCRQLTALLMEVIAAFHLTGDGTNHSFMGRGVTVSATICLSHVAAEMQSVSQEGMWFEDWLYNHQSNESSPPLGLEWLIPLWTHKDPEVRVASLSIIVCLTNSRAGCRFALTQIQQVARGVVGVGLSFLLESSEASVVREQAALLLVNLASHFIPSEVNLKPEDEIWQKLITISETDMQVPLHGIAAFLTLLHRSNFMKEMAALFENFSIYPKLSSYIRSRHMQHTDTSNLSSSTTLTSFDFGNMVSTDPTSITSTHFLPNTAGLEISPGSFNDYRAQCVGAEQGNTAITRPVEQVMTSLSTPTLVSSVCLLLRNLVNMESQDTLISMKQEAIFDHLIRILYETKYVVYKQKSVIFQIFTNLSDVMDMMSNIIELLTVCCQTDPHITLNIGTHKTILGLLISCLDVSLMGPAESLQKLWVAAYSLLTAILLSLDEKGLDRLACTLLEKKHIILGNILNALVPASPHLVKLAALDWLSQSLSTFYNLRMRILNQKLNFDNDIYRFSEEFLSMFDTKGPSFDGDNDKEIGVILATRLLILQKLIPHNLEGPENVREMSSVLNAFAALLQISHTAKMEAIEDNLITRTLEQLKRINAHVNLAMKDVSKTSTEARKREVMMNLIGHFSLLKNLMHKCSKAKSSANENGFPLVIVQFWAMALKDRSGLLSTLLSTLCTYVAHCVAAGQSLATTSMMSSNQKGGTSVTLLHEVIKVCQQSLIYDGTLSKSDSILELSFTLLSSVSCVPLCRSIIAKSKLLHYFSIDQLKKGHLPSPKDVIASFWLKLLRNFSFISEGQVAVLGIPDIIEILLHFVNKGGLQEREDSLLILRNLCFLPLGKTKLLNSDELVAALGANALNGGQRNQVIAASAIWALLANSQRAKAVIKCDHFLHRVQDALQMFAGKESASSDEKRTIEILEIIQVLLKDD